MAAQSHLPHVAAFALAAALASDLSFLESSSTPANSATSLRDTTRIASSGPKVWRDILLANAHHVLPRIEQLEKCVGDIRAAVAAGDGAALEHLLTAAPGLPPAACQGMNGLRVVGALPLLSWSRLAPRRRQFVPSATSSCVPHLMTTTCGPWFPSRRTWWYGRTWQSCATRPGHVIVWLTSLVQARMKAILDSTGFAMWTT